MYGSHSCQFHFLITLIVLNVSTSLSLPLQTPSFAHKTVTRYSDQNHNFRPFPIETSQISCLMQYFFFLYCLIRKHETDSAVPTPRYQTITQGPRNTTEQRRANIYNSESSVSKNARSFHRDWCLQYHVVGLQTFSHITTGDSELPSLKSSDATKVNVHTKRCDGIKYR